MTTNGKEKEYQPLTVPRLVWNKEGLTETYGEIVVQPLESGFGMTFGNALRRVLLGGIEGAAVTSIIVKGINSEFTAVSGIVEDAMQLVLNIKQIVVRSKNGKSGSMTLSIRGEATATVADIKADAHLELINKDHIIAHVAHSGELEIEFFVEPGRGYVPAQWPTDLIIQEDGRIYVDAVFSPIKKVVFEVQKARVGKEIDYDKLVLKIYTNGALSPVDALHYAVSVLRTQLELFLVGVEIPFNDISAVPVVEEKDVQEHKVTQKIKGVSVELLLKPIDELELSVRAHNCLMNADIKRVVDLVNLTEDEGLKIKNFGRKSLSEVKDSIKAFGLSFGMNIQEEELQRAMREQELSVHDEQ